MNTKAIALKSAFISLIFHLSILSLFTFTLTPRSPSKQPQVIFLGSILRAYDLKVAAPYFANQADKLPKNIASRMPRTKQERLDSDFIEKPPFSKQIAEQKKTTLKPKMDFDYNKKFDKLPQGNKDISEEIPVYKPLKLLR